MAWNHKVKIKHCLTEKEDYDSVQKSMNKIADILEKEICFSSFDISEFRKIPKGDNYFSPADYSNKMLDKMYDFADLNRIWLE